MDIKIDEDRIGHRPRRAGVLSRLTGALAGLSCLAAFAAVAVVALIGGDPETLRRLALTTLWPAAAHDYGRVYASLSIPGIAAGDFDGAVAGNLTRLEEQPCDQAAMLKLGRRLVAKGRSALAGQAFLGFSQSCHGNEAAQREAANLFFTLGDYGNARALFSDLVDRFPHYDNDWYGKGRAEAALGQRDAALESYAASIALAGNPALLGESVFTEMAALYAGQDRFCEAMAPIDAYVAIRPQERDTARMRQLVDGYAKRGACASYARGSDSFPVMGKGVIQVRASIDGATGTFLIDTGASFVAVTEAFAARAGLKTDEMRVGTATTANGDARVRLSRAGSIRLGRVRADGIAVVVLGKPLGNADGLLGRSFLSRFDMAITGDHLSLHSKE